MKRPLKWLGVSALVLGMWGCDAFSNYPKKIQEFPEPWRNIDPGEPPSVVPRVEVLTQGQGVAAESGDLVQIRVIDWFADVSQWHDFGDWWILIGFNSPKETPFFSLSPTIAGGVLGQRQGSRLRILDPSPNPSDHGFLGELRPNPFGDKTYYSWRKNTNEFLTPSPPKPLGGYSVLEIKRVCKGQSKFRTVRLFDDSPVRIWRGVDSYVSKEPREAWIDEAKSEAVCQDGRKVTFEYGPTGSHNGKVGRSPVQGYFDNWLRDAWDKVPKGVQFEGNTPPKAQSTRLNAWSGKSLQFNILANVRDPDKDKLTVRVLRYPLHGKLAVEPDGSGTYTPEPGWFGSDGFQYRVSDGLVESDEARIDFTVSKAGAR